MKRKIITISIALAVLLCIAGIAFADNNTTADENQTESVIDLSNYITVLSSENNAIRFSDGYVGFLVDSSKNEAGSADGFTSHPATGISNGNVLKLAIIECYKQGSENKIGEVLSSFADGSYQTSSDEIITAARTSADTVRDHEVVEINNTTEATFDFELLKPVNGATSQYIAYKVSFKTVENEDVLAASDNDTNESALGTVNDTNESVLGAINDTDNNITNKSVLRDVNDTNESALGTVNETNVTVDNNTGEIVNDTEVHETNKTIVNKTNTLVVNQNNTTVVNQNTIKTINNTTKETPQNDTVATLMKSAGNPIFLLAIVIVIAAVVGVVYYRKN